MKKQVCLWFVILFATGSTSAIAAGVIQLKGKLVAFSPSEVTIEVRKTQLYVIDRSALGKTQSEKCTKAGAEVSLEVPMQAIKIVKDR